MDKLFDAAVAEAVKETRALAVPGHALEGPYLLVAVEEDIDTLSVEANEHHARVRPLRRPLDLVDLVGHGALDRHNLHRPGILHVAPS